MTSQNFSSAHPLFPLGQRMLYFQSLSELLMLTKAAFSLGHLFQPHGAEQEVVVPLEESQN